MNNCCCETYPVSPDHTGGKISRIEQYYLERMSSACPDWQLLGWENQSAQYRRFAVLESLLEPGQKILDVGCGLGNLLDYFQIHEHIVDYTGIDILELMVEKARAKHPAAHFEVQDIFREDCLPGHEFDIVFSSGIFNINLGNNEEFLCKAVKRFCEFSRGHVVCSLLHERSPDKESRYFYSDPRRMSALISRSVPDCSISIIDNYLPNDYSLLIALPPVLN